MTLKILDVVLAFCLEDFEVRFFNDDLQDEGSTFQVSVKEPCHEGIVHEPQVLYYLKDPLPPFVFHYQPRFYRFREVILSIYINVDRQKLTGP